MTHKHSQECTPHLVVLDTFADLDAGYTRTVPGDCYCIKCWKAVPFFFNNGDPKEYDEEAASAVTNLNGD